MALGDGLATESDTLLRVEDRALPDEGLDTTGTTIDLVKSDLVDDLGTMLPMVKEKLVLVDLCFMFRQSCRIAVTYLRRALICSIFSGSCSAKRSLRVYIVRGTISFFN